MNILLIGGTGTISSSITRLLLARGDQVWLFNRGNNREFEAMGAHYILGDLRDPEGMKTSLAGLSFDAIADFYCFLPDQARRDFELFQGRTSQFLFISSCTVYQKPLKSWPIREDTPLKNPYSDYARNKIACEQYFLERYREDDFPVTIIRPSHTYSETRLISPLSPPPDKLWTLADRMLRGQEIIVHGDGRSIWTLTHSDDFAAGFIGLMGLATAIGHAFHITSDELLTWNEIMTLFADALGVKPQLAFIPSVTIETAWPKFKGSLLGDKAENLIFDNAKLKRFVPGFQTKIPFYQGIRRSIAYYRAHPELQGIDEQYNIETDALISRYRYGKSI